MVDGLFRSYSIGLVSGRLFCLDIFQIAKLENTRNFLVIDTTALSRKYDCTLLMDGV